MEDKREPGDGPFMQDNEPAAMTEEELRLAAMTTMASALVHELVQPLTAAIGFLDGCRRRLDVRPDEAELAMMVERASRQTLKAIEIIRRMRGFVVDGRVRGKSESLRNMLDRVRGQLVADRQPDAAVRVLVGAGADFVLADRIQIEQVLTNLLVNALEAVAGSPSRRIQVSSRRRGDEIEIRVRDSGPGITEEQLARLWDPLFTTKPNGTGFGLPICKSIIEAHGGRLWATNCARGGTTFHVVLPAADPIMSRN